MFKFFWRIILPLTEQCCRSRHLFLDYVFFSIWVKLSVNYCSLEVAADVVEPQSFVSEVTTLSNAIIKSFLFENQFRRQRRSEQGNFYSLQTIQTLYS